MCASARPVHSITRLTGVLVTMRRLAASSSPRTTHVAHTPMSPDRGFAAIAPKMPPMSDSFSSEA